MPKKSTRNLYEVTCRVEGKKYHFYGKTLHEAEAKRQAFKERAARIPLSLDGYTLGESVAASLETIQNDVAPQTYSSYRYELEKYIVNAQIGATALIDLTPMMFRSYWQLLLEQGLSPRTVGYIHTVTSTALKQAVLDGAIMTNPLLAVKRPRMPRSEAKALDHAQIDALLSVVDDEMFLRLIRTALATGMRRGELQGLMWKDVDFKAGTLSVSQSIVKEDGKEVVSKALKTKSSRRTITIDQKTLQVLRVQHTYCQRLRMQHGWPALCFVFPREDGAPLRQNTISKKFSQYCRQAGLEGFTFHSLRHTHATELVKAGIHFKIIQARLGHSSFMVTMDTYSHVSPGEDKSAAEAIERIL